MRMRANDLMSAGFWKDFWGAIEQIRSESCLTLNTWINNMTWMIEAQDSLSQANKEGAATSCLFVF